MTQRQAAKHFNISRDSVAKMLSYSTPPGYRRQSPIRRPKLDAFVATIDHWQGGAADLPLHAHSTYDRQLSCQIWSLQGALIGRSDGAPDEKLSDHEDGFSETVIDGETWRVYAVTNEELGVRVLVGDSLWIRDRLVNDVIRGLLLPALLILPVLAALIWLSVRRGLEPLRKIAGDLETRHASDLSPIDDVEAAREIAPVLQSLNGLFARVAG